LEEVFGGVRVSIKSKQVSKLCQVEWSVGGLSDEVLDAPIDYGVFDFLGVGENVPLFLVVVVSHLDTVGICCRHFEFGDATAILRFYYILQEF
jgi:hypothetical protein